MNIALWIAQAILAVVFAVAGGMKLTQPKAALAAQMPLVEDVGAGTLLLIGLLEVLGAVGVFVPMLIDVLPWITSWAALGLALVMVVAMALQVRHRHLLALGGTGTLLALAEAVRQRHGL
jgi:hypothetical protein